MVNILILQFQQIGNVLIVLMVVLYAQIHNNVLNVQLDIIITITNVLIIVLI